MTSRTRRPGTIHISAPSFPTAPRPSVYRKIAYTFLGLTVVVLVAVLWLTSVRAEVVVKARRDAVKLENTVEIAKTPSGGQLPGRVLRDTFERVQEFTVSDPVEEPPTIEAVPPPEAVLDRLPDDHVRARGTVKIINKYSRNQILVATTRLFSPDKKLYRIDKRVEIPPGGTAEVGVYADQPGYVFEIGPSKFTIPGLYEPIQAYIYAESSEAFKALPITGENLPKPANPKPTTPIATPPSDSAKRITAADLEKAEKELLDTVFTRAKTELAARANVPNWDVVYLVRVADRKTNATVGQATDSFLSSIRLEVAAVYYPKEDMQAFVRSRLRERVPEGREILNLGSDNIVYTIQSTDTKLETAVVHISADAAYRLSATSALLQPSVVAGKSKDEAERILRAVEGVQDVQITIRPSWLSTIPSIKDKIEFTVE